MKGIKTVKRGISIPRELNEQINKYLETQKYLKFSTFVSIAIEDFLERALESEVKNG